MFISVPRHPTSVFRTISSFLLPIYLLLISCCTSGISAPPRFFPSSLLLARPLFQSPSLSAQGDNSEGQTGVVNETMVFSPPVVPVLTAVLAVATGQDFTCALRRGAPREYVVAISHLSSRAVVWKRTRALARALVLVMNTDTLLPIVLLFVCLQGVACFALGPTIWGS